MGLNLRVRHYWDKTIYQSFHELGLDGSLLDSDYTGNYDFARTFFNVDLNFNWRFSPGSDLFINWKNATFGGEFEDLDKLGYLKSFDNLNDYPQNNSLSVRIVYYLDYLNIKKWI